MHARVTNFQGSSDQVDAAVSDIEDSVLPAAKQIDGFKGALWLVDRESGKGIGVTLWSSEDAMKASEQQADEMRSSSAERTGGEITDVDRYEVAVSELPGG